MKEIKNICMDYDSMGDCGRFPYKKKKQPISLKQRLINLFLWVNFKRKRKKSIWEL
jgi:hypothetical protein